MLASMQNTWKILVNKLFRYQHYFSYDTKNDFHFWLSLNSLWNWCWVFPKLGLLYRLMEGWSLLFLSRTETTKSQGKIDFSSGLIFISDFSCFNFIAKLIIADYCWTRRWIEKVFMGWRSHWQWYWKFLALDTTVLSACNLSRSTRRCNIGLSYQWLYFFRMDFGKWLCKLVAMSRRRRHNLQDRRWRWPGKFSDKWRSIVH